MAVPVTLTLKPAPALIHAVVSLGCTAISGAVLTVRDASADVTEDEHPVTTAW